MFRKLMTIFILCSLIVLGGCGSTAKWQANLTLQGDYKEGEPLPIRLEVKANEQPVTGLTIQGSLEMKRMNHGTVDATFTEKGNGVYECTAEIPMHGDWTANLKLSDGKVVEEHSIDFTVNAGKTSEAKPSQEKVVATISGENITKDDIAFYELINLMQIAMYKEDDKSRLQGEELQKSLTYWADREKEAKNSTTLLTQAIRLRAMALLAKEKGHSWKQEEVNREIEQAKLSYQKYPVAMQMIEKYGEDQFWKRQQSQYESIVLMKKVQRDMIDNVKKANPKAEAKEVNMLAAKKYEELLVSQVDSLSIQLFN
ncbi:FixH family protein [Brevibacillus sp. SYSU BS000544]|uniref:FixH family protein n=1 Tax=Brevibacillus sp. SYSU BS000544 TaxID=3416443 RepID=UPI003CE45828